MNERITTTSGEPPPALRAHYLALLSIAAIVGVEMPVDRVLQAEWNRSGIEGLEFEVLELLKEREDADFDYAGELKALEQIHRELQRLM